jgi:putative SOS response-associated peptidase YedK
MDAGLVRRCSIILVHGTWPRGFFPKRREGSSYPPNKRCWFEEGSQFLTRLHEALTSASLDWRFQAFLWTGANSVHARDCAARELSDQLKNNWRAWLNPENRCLVPANCFAEYAPEPNPDTNKKDVVWFALKEERPLFAFAGIWTTFNGDRGTKSKPIPGPHQVYGFLTTSPNAVVEPIHEKAMPVILTTDEERDVWMRARGMRRERCKGHCPMTR